MKDPVQRLRAELTRIREFSSESIFYIITPDERDTLLERSDELLHKLDVITQGTLMVGLLGGTGVGKSSLMNALAGSEIAATSHRRPLTDSVLIYRYGETPLPVRLPLSTVPWEEYTHEVESIRQILLCDLPDFDSLMGEHRNRVIDFVEYLDVLIWVTSPEKYADARFYEFLRDVPKAKKNFYFVLNKADMLFEGNSIEEGFEELQKVVSSLTEHLRNNGIKNPPMYTLSAREALEHESLTPWNQLYIFRQHIFQQKELKEIKNIKAANLDEEVGKLLHIFDREVSHLETFHNNINETIRQLKEDNADLVTAVHESMNVWAETTPLRWELMSIMTDPAILIGPSTAFVYFEGKGREGEKIHYGDESEHIDNYMDECTTIIMRLMDRLKNQLTGDLQRKGIPSPLIGRAMTITDKGRQLHDMKEKIVSLRTRHFSIQRLPSYRLFRGIQYITYLLLFFILLFALAGEGAWQKFYAHPGLASSLNFVITALYAIFSPRGLAALGSYVLINVFFGYRFYSRYKKLLKRNTEQLIHSFSHDVVALWKKEMESVSNDLQRLSDEVKGNISLVSEIKG